MQELAYQSSLINTQWYTLSRHQIPPDTNFIILLLDAMHPLTSDGSGIKSWQKNDFKCLQTWKKRSVKHTGIAYMQSILEVFACLHMINLFSFCLYMLFVGLEHLNYIFIVGGCSSCISRSINLPRHWGPIARLNNPFLEQDLKSSEQSNQLVFWGWRLNMSPFESQHNCHRLKFRREITAMALFLLRHRHEKTPSSL